MILQTPWIERKFNFDFPAGLYPSILERLQGTPARVEEMVSGISEERLMKKTGNSWSVKEHIGHHTDLEALHEGRLDDLLRGEKILRAADMSNIMTNQADHNSKPANRFLNGF